MLLLPPIPTEQTTSASHKEYSESGKKILVVEDFREIRASLALLLRKLGHDVYLASDGLEGWRAFRRRSFDLILTDIKMPGLGGDALIVRINRISPRTPVIVMIASEIDTGRMLLESGKAMFVLHKPFEASELTGFLDMIWKPLF
jgi:two-component system response regulator HydG